MKLCQLTGTDSPEIVVLFTNPKISSLLKNEHWEGFQQFFEKDLQQISPKQSIPISKKLLLSSVT